MKFISKGNWFDRKEICQLIDDYGNNLGLFCGMRTCQDPLSEGSSHNVGERYLDEEVCNFDEFLILL